MHDLTTLDNFDLRILGELQEHGKLTNQEAGDRIGLSASQCSRRRIAREKAGVIKGYSARLSAEALGFPLLVILQVTLDAHDDDNAEGFRKLISQTDAVQECYAVTGDTDCC